ncbi:MAG: FG-GAP-like repeat-containing protein, partial [Planctomycetota bacterium]
PSTDLGDLDGDGDLDLVVSSYGNGYWRMFRNDGSGAYTFWRDISAPSNPSCSILVDTDRDGDLDLALTDEIADLVTLMKNQ